MSLSKTLKDLENLDSEIQKLIYDYEQELKSLKKCKSSLELAKRSYLENQNENLINAFSKLTLTPNYNPTYTPLKYFLTSFNKYMINFSEAIVNTLQNNEKLLRYNNLELQDNAYGRNYQTYTSLTRKGYSTNYHPNLACVEVSPDITDSELEELLIFVESIKTLKFSSNKRLDYTEITIPQELFLFLSYLNSNLKEIIDERKVDFSVRINNNGSLFVYEN